MENRPTLLANYPHILHGGDYNPDQWLNYPEIIDEDFRLMKLAGCNTFSLGIFAWTSYEPEEGQFTFDWLDRIMDRMAEAGHKVILATPSGAKPAWMSLKYPEIRRVNREGRREVHRYRHNHCWSSPIYREKVKIINTHLVERYRDHPALGMWHLSNEYNGECLCDLCLASWHRWLQNRYKTLDELNHAYWAYFWSHTFTDWEQVDPRQESYDGLTLDWLRFLTWQNIDFIQWEMQPLRKYTPHIPVTTNFMGTFRGLNYAEVSQALDLVTDDQYPAYDADDPELARKAVAISFKDNLLRCFKPGRPWMLMESCPESPQWKKPNRLKRPGLHQAEMLQALGHGAEGTCYFQWRKGRGGHEKFHGAVVDHAGHEHTRAFQTVAELGKLYQKLPPILGSQVEAQVGILYDWEARWAFELSDGPVSTDWIYDRVCHDHYQTFWEQGISVDVFDSNRDFSPYRLLITPQLWMIKPGVAQRLQEFVAQGGVLVSTYYTGIVNESNLCLLGGWPGDGLKEVFGVWNEETDALHPDVTRKIEITAPNPLGLKGPYQAQGVCGLVHLNGAQPLAIYAEDFYAGIPALTVHTWGKGQAYYQAARLQVADLRDFYQALIRQMKLPAALPGELPAGVTVQVRHKGEQTFWFLQNFSSQTQIVNLGGQNFYRFSNGNPLSDKLVLKPFESDVLGQR